MTKLYQVLKGRISRPEADGKRHLYEPGDEIEMTDEQYEATGAVLAPVHAAPPAAPEEEAVAAKPRTAAELVELIATSDDPKAIREILDAEHGASRPRKSVIEAAEAKLAMLED